MLKDDQIETIVLLFDEPDTTWDILYIIKQIEKKGYAKPQRVMRDALRDGLLYVDNIESDNTIMVALTEWGEHVWDELNE